MPGKALKWTWAPAILFRSEISPSLAHSMIAVVKTPMKWEKVDAGASKKS
jgi:hypothetical protein